MKWYTKPKPRMNDTRIRYSFLWFPKHIGTQTRWLEFAYYEQRFLDRGLLFGEIWQDVCWIDKTEFGGTRGV